MFRPPDAEEALPSRATVGRPGATLQTPRPRLVASLLSVRNWQQLGKFCVVGAIGYLINLAVYDLLLHRGVHYLGNRVWTFREHRGHVGIQGMRFFLVSLAALGANLLLLHVLIADGGLGRLAAQAIAVVLVMPLNFVGNKLWSFRLRT